MAITVIGDIIQDEYVYCSTSRISPEAPIPVFREIRRETRDGGALNVVNNLRILGSDVSFPYDVLKCNSVKTRYVCDNKIVFRSDKENYVPKKVDKYDNYGYNNYVVLSDYNKGALTDTVKLISRLCSNGAKVIVDAKKHISKYAGAYLVKMNEKEFIEYGGDSYVGLNGSQHYGIENLLVTCGKDGMTLFTFGHFPHTHTEHLISTPEVSVSDVTGAGDVVTAAIAHYLDKGKSLIEACEIAAELASISVSHFGTYTLTKEDIKKVVPKIVFTNGCFDILHAGHIELLKRAKEMGDVLVVGLNGDDSVKRLKGEDRPVNDEASRKAALESIKYVDKVFIFNEDTPLSLIELVKPDIIVKGGDYRPDEVVGNHLATVVIVPLVDGHSTTKIIEKVRK